MEFKKEVREFMAWSRAEGSVRDQLIKQNQELMDRLMARDFVELKTYNPSFPEDDKETPKYDSTKDETAAGEII